MVANYIGDEHLVVDLVDNRISYTPDTMSRNTSSMDRRVQACIHAIDSSRWENKEEE